jgi:hypothetical protein
MADTPYAPLTPSPTAVRNMYEMINSSDYFARVVLQGDDQPFWTIARFALEIELHEHNTLLNPAYHRKTGTCGLAWTDEVRRIVTMLRAALRLY